MQNHANPSCWIVILTVVTAALSPPIRAAEPRHYANLATEKSSAYVSVKFVLKKQGRFGNQENEGEAAGIMIDPSGLVLCSNSAVGGSSFFSRFGSATPTDLKVLIGNDTEGLDAELLARDSELDLTWVRIKEPGDKTFAYLDLSKAATPTLGQPLMALRKMGKYFGRAVVVSEGRLAGKTSKPRKLFVPGGGLDLEPGLPVFTLGGRVVGIVVIQMPDKEEMGGDFLAFRGMARDIAGGLILPAADVLKATRRAEEIAKEDEDENEDEDEDGSPVKKEPTSKPDQRKE